MTASPAGRGKGREIGRRWRPGPELEKEGSWDLWILDVVNGKTIEFLGTEERAEGPVFSPDGRWLAYSSDVSGDHEIVVRHVEGGDRQTVSSGRGREPVWSKDGTELFYRHRDAFYSVPMNAEGVAGPPVFMFESPFERNPGPNPNFDVAPDGRFLMIQREQPATPGEIRVIVNWVAELERRF